MPSYIWLLITFPRAVLLSLFCPNFYLGLSWVRLQLAPRNDVYERANFSENGRASASMNAVSRDRFTPAAAVDAVTPTYLRATAADFHPTYKNVHGRNVHVMARRPSHSEGVHRVPIIFHASRPSMGLEAGGHLHCRQCHVPFLPAF